MKAADPLDLVPPPQPEELLIALCLVQALDPAGVGARDVAECLQLPLRAAPAGATRGLAQTILAQHLQALAAGDLRALARRLGARAPPTRAGRGREEPDAGEEGGSE